MRAFRRIRRIYYALAVAGCVIVVLSALNVPALGMAGFGLILLSPILGAIPAAVLFRILTGRTVRPASEILVWRLARIRSDWLAVDGGQPPESADDGLARLGERSDGLAVRWRTVLLAGDERWNDARASLSDWPRTDPTATACRARLESAIAFDESGTDDLSSAEAATLAIPDVAIRNEQVVLLAIERARQASIRGGDALEVLARARPLLPDATIRGAIKTLRRPLRQDPRRLLSWVLIGGLAIFLVLVLIDLAQ
jgi:hypothetical protein